MAKSSIPLTVERLKQVLSYDHETGTFIRVIQTSSRVKVGDVAGTINDRGYRQICVDNRLYFAHRLAWLFVHGAWPENHIDHVNHNTDDNRIANLREATRSQNLGNSKTRRDNSSGFKGISWHAQSQKWLAQIQVQKERIYLGTFATREDAATAYKAASIVHFGMYAFTGD